ncbi:MAG: hypothetical protein QOD32_2734 [Pyrinomonadaceae bacterium]|jgi:hypothetical protein|nr:hypothetical protein [Pyrinomonadaceae bacterium]
MTTLRARAFLPALFVQIFIALAISQPAFSQETQAGARPSPPATTNTNTAATGEKVATQVEACEQTPAAVAAAPASIEQIGAGQKATDATASQPSSFAPAQTLKVGSARAFSFASDARPASKVFDAPSGLAATDSNDGAQQTGADVYTPLTSEQKMRRAFKSAFLSPQAYALPLVSAIITEAGEDDLPHKDTDDRVADGLSRFAIKFGRRATNNLLGGGVYASIFRQDPRYERAAEGKGFAARVAHAASRVFVTRGDNGKHQPNYSRFAGQLSSSALSNLWEQSTPGHDRIGVDATFRRFGTSFITGAIFNVLNEFLPDIKGIFGK